MKNLILVRHAKSSWEFEELADFERPLNLRGLRDAPRMAHWFMERKIRPDAMVTSPAARALSTCEIFADVLGFPRERILALQGLYHAGDDEIFGVVKAFRDVQNSEEALLLFGHNPGLTLFANRLAGIEIENIPTAGIVSMRLVVTHWKDITWGCGHLLFHDWPKRH